MTPERPTLLRPILGLGFASMTLLIPLPPQRETTRPGTQPYPQLRCPRHPALPPQLGRPTPPEPSGSAESKTGASDSTAGAPPAPVTRIVSESIMSLLRCLPNDHLYLHLQLTNLLHTQICSSSCCSSVVRTSPVSLSTTRSTRVADPVRSSNFFNLIADATTVNHVWKQLTTLDHCLMI